MVVRIVSLVPSVTETLLAWGVEPVAVTRFCEQPRLVAVGGTKNPDIDAIVALRPDVVVMDREENTLPAAEAISAAGIKIHVTHVRALGDVGPTLGDLAAVAGIGPQPVCDVVELPCGTNRRPGRRPRAWVPIWRRPWMTVNGSTYGSSMLAAAGVDNVWAGAADAYPVTSLDVAVAACPDVVFAPSEPYAFTQRHRAELEQVAPVMFVDGKDLFWWGVRTGAALGRLSAIARRVVLQS